MEENKMKKVEEIAKKLGIPLNKLLENKTPEMVIEEYIKGNLHILND